MALHRHWAKESYTALLKKGERRSRGRWFMPGKPALGRPRQEDPFELQGRLHYILRETLCQISKVKEKPNGGAEPFGDWVLLGASQFWSPRSRGILEA